MANERNAGRKRKLTPLEEITIVNKAGSGTPICELAWEYKVSESTIHRIIRRSKDVK